MIFFLVLFLTICANSANTPSWRAPVPSSSSVHASSSSSGRDVVRIRQIVHDTVHVKQVVVDTVLILKNDTIRIVDTVKTAPPVQYKYVIRYALTSFNVSAKNPEWLDNASHSEVIARDTATLKIGVETVRTLGVIIDQFGNRVPQTDLITTGFTINVFGDRAFIEYRGEKSLAVFSGGFDSSGFLIATGEITETSFFTEWWPFNLFFSASRKKIIIEITREAYL